MLQVVPPFPSTEQQHGNIFDLYFDFMQNKEPPNIFNRWCMVTSVGALLGRQFWLPFGESRLFPNTYCMLIGDPGSRKSTAIRISKRVVKYTGYRAFAADKTTKEKFLLDLEGADDIADGTTTNAVMQNLFGDEGYVPTDPREVYICADEFNEFLGAGNLEFLSLLGSMWDHDDVELPWTYRLKNSKSVAIYQPTISILGGNTHTGFAECFPPAAMGQGFLSRLLMIYGEESGRKETIPSTATEEVRNALIASLNHMREVVKGQATITPKALQMLHVIYRQPPVIEDSRFKHYCSRRLTHLLKLCLVVAATNLTTTIGMQEVLTANSILSYAEHFMPQALGEFGVARNNSVGNRIIAILTERRGLVTHDFIWKQVINDLAKPEDLHALMQGFLQAGKVQYIVGNGDRKTGYTIVRKMLSDQQLYVDYKLLREYTNP